MPKKPFFGLCTGVIGLSLAACTSLQGFGAGQNALKPITPQSDVMPFIEVTITPSRVDIEPTPTNLPANATLESPMLPMTMIFASSREDHIGLFFASADGRLIVPVDFKGVVRNTVWPHISPDGSQIAFAEVQGPRAEYSLGIYVSDITGDNVRRLVTGDGTHPRWSRDGSKIAFTCNGGADVCVMNADGSGLFNATPGSETSLDLYPDWAEDGNLVFMSNRNLDSSNGPVSEIYYLFLDTLETARLTFDGTAFNAYPRVSPDNTRIAFESNQDVAIGSEIYTFDLNGNNLQRATFDEHWNQIPVFTQDSQSLIFTMNPTKENWDLFQGDLNGRSVRVLTQSPAEDGGLRFGHSSLPFPINMSGSIQETALLSGPILPEGSEPLTNAILFAASDFNCPACLASGIYTVNFDGANLHPLGIQGFFPAWDRDFSRFAFVRDGELFIANADGNQITQVTYASLDFRSITFSPSGRYIAAECNPYGQFDLCIIDLVDRRISNLSPELTIDSGVRFPSWVGEGELLTGNIVVDRSGIIKRRLALPGLASHDSYSYVSVQDGQIVVNGLEDDFSNNIVIDTTFKAFPRFSPDSTLVIYTVAPGDGGLYLWIVQQTGNNPVQLTPKPFAVGPTGDEVVSISTFLGYNWGP